jgi:hypothetical protein
LEPRGDLYAGKVTIYNMWDLRATNKLLYLFLYKILTGIYISVVLVAFMGSSFCVFPFQLLKQLIDFREIWYERYVI